MKNVCPSFKKLIIDVPLSLFGREAFRSLYRNKMRSALSAIGIAAEWVMPEQPIVSAS